MFTGKDFVEFCQEENIELIHTTTGIPRGNGQIERTHRMVISILTKPTIENPDTWFKHVKKAQIFLNKTFQRSINTTPGELMFGVPIKTKDDILMREIIEQETANMFTQERENQCQETRVQIAKIQEQNRRDYNKNRKKAYQYMVGDHVAIKRTQFGGGLKLEPKNLGPYEIIKKKPNDRYDLKKIGIHDGPHQTMPSADNMILWPNSGYETVQVNMLFNYF